jgi:sugar lactone lactonase YvrE
MRAAPALALVGLVACSASAADRPSVRLDGVRSATAGTAWSGVLVVTPVSAGRPALTARLGTRSRRGQVAATGRGRYRARLVLPAAGRWLLTARLGRRTFRLGAVTAVEPLVLRVPAQAAIASDGRLLVAEQGRDRVIAIEPATAAIAVLGRMPMPFGLARAPSGDLYVSSHGELMRVDPSGGVTTVLRAAGDIGPIAIGPSGEVYFPTTEDRIFRLDPASGAVKAVAGSGRRGAGGDGGPALAAEFGHPHGLVVGADGSLLVADTENGRIRRVDGRTGIVSTLATGLSMPWGIALAADGSIYAAEPLGHRIRRADPAGRLTTVAGTGVRGSSGDGGPALRAAVDAPTAVALDAAGLLYVLESETGHVRRIGRDGTISTLGSR